MNQRNVEALEALLPEAWRRSVDVTRAFDPDSISVSWRTLAELLTSRGVLAPSALTEHDAMNVALRSVNMDVPHSVDGECMAAVLARIAKGEPL